MHQVYKKADQTASFNERMFYKSVLSIGVPVIFQQLLSSCLNMIDTIMVGRLGEISVAAVAVANKLVYVYNLVIFGLCTGLSIFVSQYFGAKEYSKIGKLSGFMYVCALIFGIIFTAVFALFAPNLIGLFVNDSPEIVNMVISEGSEYLYIICFSIIIMGLSFAMSSLCRGVMMTKLPLYATVLSVLTNAVLNYVLIFGKFGFPQMGVKGAAIATVIARLAEFLMLVAIIYSPKSNNPIKTNLKNMFTFPKDFTLKLIKTASPVVVNETMWSLAQTAYVAIVGILGASAVAVIQISTTINNMFYSLIQGVSVACSVMVGSSIGAGDFALAKKYAWRFLFIAICVALSCGAVLIIFKGGIVSLFTLEEQTYPIMYKTLNVTACVMGLSMLNNIFIVGLFRSGGDTKFCMYVEALTLWLVGIPLLFVCVKFLNVPVYAAAALMQSDNFIKMFICFNRFVKGKWINRVIETND